MGIVTLRNGVPYVFEAVNPVKYTPLADWIARGENRTYAVKRLKDSAAILTPSAIQKLKSEEKRFEGRSYDLTFEWSDDRIYCSELVWKVYDRALGMKIGKLQHLKEFDLGDPIVKRKLSERYGDAIPMNETVISPSSIYESENLVTVKDMH